MTGSGPVHATARGTRIDLRVIPRSSPTGIEGIRNGRVVLRVTAPPVDSAANDAVIAALSDLLDVPRRSVRLVGGSTRRNKTVEVEGLRVDDVLAKLRQPEAERDQREGRGLGVSSGRSVGVGPRAMK